jgi:hypothetical protein
MRRRRLSTLYPLHCDRLFQNVRFIASEVPPSRHMVSRNQTCSSRFYGRRCWEPKGPKDFHFLQRTFDLGSHSVHRCYVLHPRIRKAVQRIRFPAQMNK